jgi:transmembrane sensor
MMLSSGEVAEAAAGTTRKLSDSDSSAFAAWRKGLLIFRGERLADVVQQINRYNTVQIQVEGAAARDTLLTATFKTQGYNDVLEFARKTGYLSVTAQGSNYLIRSRQ